MMKISRLIWITVAMTSLYLVANNLPAGIGSFRFFWAPLTLMIIFFHNQKILNTKTMKYLLLYGLVSLLVLQFTLWVDMSNWNRSLLFNEFYALLVFTVILNYYLVNKDYNGLAALGKISFYLILITIITTNVALSFDPFVVRQSAAPDKFTAFQARIFKITGAGGYGYMQALVLLLPVLIYFIKFKNKFIFSRKMLIVILVMILITLVRAQVFANILVAVAFTTIALIGKERARKSVVPISLAMIIILAIPPSFYARMFVSLSSYVNPHSNIYYKLNDVSIFIMNPEFDPSTGAGGRAARYPMLFEAFSANPIFGNASYDGSFNVAAGGHLYWMNKLTMWGIPGFIFFLFVLFKLYKKIRSLFDDSFGFYYFLSTGAFISLGLIKNISGREPFLILIVVIPGLYFSSLNKKRKKLKI